ncbi:hypothetical protein D3C73_1167190 [compost metagenome]
MREQLGQNTQAEAIARTEVVIHRENGQIRDKNRYGNDPYLPKGRGYLISKGRMSVSMTLFPYFDIPLSACADHHFLFIRMIGLKLLVECATVVFVIEEFPSGYWKHFLEVSIPK